MTSRVALVTGGSRGIGRATVEALLAEGWTVAFTYVHDADAARDLVDKAGGGAAAFSLDLRDRDGPERLVRTVQASHGDISALVTNAAVREERLLAMMPDADWDRVIDVNLGGLFRCCRAVLPVMMRNRAGSIVNVSSLSAIAGLPGQTAYAASKAAILGLTRSLAREAGRRGVRVNAVLPGFVSTDMTRQLPEETVRFLRSRECLGTGTSPENVADMIAFLLSARAAAVTGQAIVVDAGASA